MEILEGKIQNLIKVLQVSAEMDKYNRDHVIVDSKYSEIGNIQNHGVRICSLRRMGYIPFDNIVVPYPTDMMLNSVSDIPSYAKNLSDKDKYLIRYFLLMQAVNSVKEKVWFFIYQEKELDNLESITHG